jgi:peptidoglycan L-alanyl-D-glutamate endopeptidase CwlK
MKRFSETSKSKLSGCHRDLQTLFNHIILDRDCTVICGFRDEIAQNTAFSEGNTQKKWPDSKHNTQPSLAVDVAPYEASGVDWGKLQSAEFAGYVMGVADQLLRIGSISHRIRRGVDWDGDYDVDDTKFWDACHFEIMPL